jgi:hypothetical protein
MTEYTRYRLTYTDHRMGPNAPWHTVTVQATTAALASRVLTDCGLTVLDIVNLSAIDDPSPLTAEITLND